MTTLTLEKEPTARRVECTDEYLVVHLTDGRTVSAPLDWYPRLAFGTPEERANVELVADGWGLHWPELDEDLHVEGILAGKRSGEGERCFRGWKAAMQERRRLRAKGEEPPPWGTGDYRIPYAAFLPGDDE